MEDKAVKTLIANDFEPTIANIYKACYSGKVKGEELAQRLTQKAWEELRPQVEEVITEAGYPVNQENLEDAKWLIENRLPLTKHTFAYKKELEIIKTDLTKEQLLDRIMTAMKNGTAPLEASLHSDPEFSYEKLMEDIHSITQDTLVQAVRAQEKLTIDNLAFLGGKDAAGNMDNSEVDTSGVTSAGKEFEAAREVRESVGASDNDDGNRNTEGKESQPERARKQQKADIPWRKLRRIGSLKRFALR